MRKYFAFLIIFFGLFVGSVNTSGFVLYTERAEASNHCADVQKGSPAAIEAGCSDADIDAAAAKEQKDAQIDAAGCGFTDVGCKLKTALTQFLTYVIWLVLKIVGLTTMLAGGILNYSVKYTIIDMAQKFNAGGAGIGTAVNAAWTTVRDVANMSFIFILLYSSILLILGIKSAADTRKLVVNMIIAALLINFSLFFTKVFIDFSNMVALVFYEAIAPGAAAPGATVLTAGISNTLMRPLGLSSLLALSENGLIGPGQIVTLGIMGSVMLLIATFIFASIALILIIRYVILIFLLILSPLAFVSDVIPGAKNYFGMWKTALINQSFFPAIYFLSFRYFE